MQSESLFTEQQLRGTRSLPKCITNLVAFSKLIAWEDFREILDARFPQKTTGRKPYDRVLMTKILVLKRMYNLSDDDTEGMLYDRQSFKDFCDLGVGDRIPDAKTIWNFQQELGVEGIDALSERFSEMMEARNITYSTGSIVDATFTETPIRRATIPSVSDVPSTPEEQAKRKHQLRQIDKDATFTKKGNKTFFGYKAHVVVDQGTKLIRKTATTTASVHDSNVFLDIVPKGTIDLYADSAYRSEETEEQILKKKMNSHVTEKGYRNTPLTAIQKESNKEKSRVRARGEHPFATIKKMGGDFIRTIGLQRATFQNTLTNLVYNMKRAVFLVPSGISLNGN